MNDFDKIASLDRRMESLEKLMEILIKAMEEQNASIGAINLELGRGETKLIETIN